MPNRVPLYVSALLASACTTSLYHGPRRPQSELAILASDDSVISAVDGVNTPYSGGNFGKYQVLPGVHAVGVSLNKVVDGGVYRADSLYTICMKAEAGKEYRVKIEMAGYQWRPYMVEESSEALVSYQCRAAPPRMPEQEMDHQLRELLEGTPKK